MTDPEDGMMAGPLTPVLKSAIEARARSDAPSWPDAVARSVAWVLMETSMQVICTSPSPKECSGPLTLANAGLHHVTLEPLLQTIAKKILQYPLADSTSTMAASSEARGHLGETSLRSLTGSMAESSFSVGYARKVSEMAGFRTLHSAGNSLDGQ